LLFYSRKEETPEKLKEPCVCSTRREEEISIRKKQQRVNEKTPKCARGDKARLEGGAGAVGSASYTGELN
jgi:hypothetical protein